MNDDKTVTKQQLNKLIAFRQQLYECLPKASDAQFQLVEALLSNRQVSSFAELSLAPRFERAWESAYDALEQGQQKQELMQHLFCRSLPTEAPVVCPLDTTVWPHPKARTLEGLVYEISPTRAARRHTAVVGHVYSLLAWVPERGRSWGLGLSHERLTLDTDALALGVKQVKELAALRQKAGVTGLLVVPVDGKYGTHHFLGPLRTVAHVAVVTRLRCDRVLYGPPPAYTGTGRPRKHGARFAFKDASTWHAPDEDLSFWDVRWGQVRLRGWQDLHMRQDAATPFRPSMSKCISNGHTRPPPFGSAIWTPSLPQFAKRGCGLTSVGRLNPVSVFGSRNFPGPCRTSKPPHAVTAGPGWWKPPFGNSISHATWRRINPCPGRSLWRN